MCLLVVCISRFQKKNNRYNSSICQRNARAVSTPQAPPHSKNPSLRSQLVLNCKRSEADFGEEKRGAAVFVFPLRRSSTARWQSLTDRRAAGAESPCCQAQIQEETLMLGNQHHNSVRRRTVQLSLSPPPHPSAPHPAPPAPPRLGLCVCVCCANVVFVVKHFYQQKILPGSLFIIPPSFPSSAAVLPSLFCSGATSICHCRCVFLSLCL